MKDGLLFLCVANSARSQMAEALARSLAPQGLEIFSAGSAPTALNAFAVEAMREIGIDISGWRSKALDEIPVERVGTVVTLCTEEVCPVFPGDVARLHWPMPDPAAVRGSDREIRESFREVRERLAAALRRYFAETARTGD